MSPTWDPDGGLALTPLTAAGWLRVCLRAPLAAAVLVCGVIATLILRLVERPIWGRSRPVTAFITQLCCRLVLIILGLRHHTRGQRMREKGAIVTNHSSWLDIFALNARKRVYFVSKAEVSNWPGIGFLARLVGTVFITRDPRRAAEQVETFRDRLGAGHKLLFFPEGTSTDGQRVLAFKPTLFEAFFAQGLRNDISIQPVTVLYHAPPGLDPRFYGWWGGMDFGPHALRVLAAPSGGRVEVIYHPAKRVAEFSGRKELALAMEEAVRAGMPAERSTS